MRKEHDNENRKFDSVTHLIASGRSCELNIAFSAVSLTCGESFVAALKEMLFKK